MKTLIQKQAEFLIDTAEFYNKTNRAYNPLTGGCFYTASETSPGCAIGRHCPPEVQKRLRGTVFSCFGLLPDALKELGPYFLSVVQTFHDNSKFFSENGVNVCGLNYLKMYVSKLNLEDEPVVIEFFKKKRLTT